MIDNDRDRQRPPLFPSAPSAVAGRTSQESIFSSLGFVSSPFPDDPAAGPWTATDSQSILLDLLTDWWDEEPAGSLALVTGSPGSGKTRSMLELHHVVARNNGTKVVVVGDKGSKRSDAQILREIVSAMGGIPAGRTGLELLGEVRRGFEVVVAAGQRPLVLIDSANFAGSQLEIMRSLLTDSGASIVLFGNPDLRDRVGRRQSLAALVGFASSLEPFDRMEIIAMIEDRLTASRVANREPMFRIEDEAYEILNDLVSGNPGAAIDLMRTVLIDCLALNRMVVDAAAVQRAHESTRDPAERPGTGPAMDVVVQTRFVLPGFEQDAPPGPDRRRRGNRGGST